MRKIQLNTVSSLSVGLSLHLVACLSLGLGLTWALLSPDPHAVLRSAGIRATSSIDDFFQHLLAFAALTVCCSSCAVRLRIPVGHLAAGLMLFAAATEVLQGLVPGRTSDIVDLCGNFIGIMMVIVATRTIRRLLADDAGQRENLLAQRLLGAESAD